MPAHRASRLRLASCCLVLVVTGAAAGAASFGNAAAVPNRYMLQLTGTLHVHGEQVDNCNPGTIRSVIDGGARIWTPQPIPVWISTGGNTPPPPAGAGGFVSEPFASLAEIGDEQPQPQPFRRPTGA